jgi:hypothetical protein
LIYTVLENESALNGFDIYGISLLKIGYQLLPKSFYDHFAKKNQIEFREIDSRKTRNDIRSRITEFLQSSSIEIVSSETCDLTVTVL